MVDGKKLRDADRNLGRQGEIETIDKLRNLFGADLERVGNWYCPFDFESKNFILEMKTRRCEKDKYLDTMIPMNKIDYLLNCEKMGFAVFNFTDGLYYYPITLESMAVCRVSNGGRCDRGYGEWGKYCYIPTDLLLNVDST